jgi:hypothetical protein
MTITLTQCLSDPDLFGTVFGDPSFWTWKVVAKLIDGMPLTEQREIALFEECTGLKYNRHARGAVRRLIVLAGRRAGKDRFESAVAVWRAALSMDWRKHQSAGEGAVVILLGADKKQAAILRKYCHGLLQTPLLKAEVTRSTGDVTEFRNGSSLEIATNDARLVRGRSAIAVLGSECCHLGLIRRRGGRRCRAFHGHVPGRRFADARIERVSPEGVHVPPLPRAVR